jgi:ubiquinone/menaquinone biosynthesis C-methylase UbiE
MKQKLEQLLANTGDLALKRRARRIIEELDPQDGDKVLDVGCGDGYYLHLLSNLGVGLSLTGVDFDENALDSAKKNLKGKKVRLIKADLMKKLPFKAGSFDKIVMSEVAEHLPDDVRGLKEVKRVLKEEGILVLTVPCANYPFFWDPVNWVLGRFFDKHIKSGFWAGIWSQHERLYTNEQIKAVAEKAGLKVQLIECLTYWCLPFNHNLIHLGAKMLYGGGFSQNLTKAISKYQENPKRPIVINFIFSLVNKIDRLNDLFHPESIGVGIFLKASKNC